MDNRTKAKSDALEEIENDSNPIDEGENPKDENPITDLLDSSSESDSFDENEDILLDDEEIDQETGEVKKRQTPTPERKALPQEEERYREQRREATILNERNRQLTDAFAKVDEVTDPSEEELQKAARLEGVEWEDLTTFERSMYKKNFVNDQKLAIVNNAVKGVKNIDEWAKTVDEYLDENEAKQTNKLLIGNESQFRSFAMKQSHRGVSMEILVPAFLHDLPETTKHKGSIMLTRTGGERVEKINKLQDAEYVASLRKNQPKEYQRLLKAGKINLQV